MEPEDYLRSLAAEALQRAHPNRPLFPVSLGLMAVANAFVMLGLLPEVQAEAILAAHRLALEHKGFGNVWGVTKGELTVRPGAHGYWQSRIAGPGAWREIPLSASAQVTVGRCDPPWPTPAECYLAALAPARDVSIGANGHVAEAGPEETAEIIATVADGLLAVGALPVASTLIREPAARPSGWQTALAHRWSGRVRQQPSGSRPLEYRELGVQLPMEDATAVIESVSVQGELVSIQLYGHPWVMGEYWPMITPCFQVRATDNAGNQHEGMPGDWHGLPGNAGSGTFSFWPPVEPARERIRVTVSTLWEAAWAEIELPR